MVEPVLSTGKGENNSVFWQFFYKFCVVLGLRFRGVTTTHNEEVPDLTGLNQLLDLTSQG
ncbi:hypothetical protein DSECCO2_374810 [anaerobic digester metagenome]